MARRTLEAHYRPNWRLAQAHGLAGYNCGYARERGGSFDDHQRELVWRLLGDTPIRSGSTVLDVGAGIGGPAGWILERFAPRRVIGIEYCGTSVRNARRRWEGRTVRPVFIQADAQRLPVADQSVDVLLSLESALHYPNKRLFLRECRRVLRPGGTLCIGDITAPAKWLFAPLRLLNGFESQFNSNLYLWSTDDYLRNIAATGFDPLAHEDAFIPAANSLADGLDQMRARGWHASRGFRARFFYLTILEKLLRRGRLRYDLFRARRT